MAPGLWACIRRTDAPQDRPLWAGSLGAGSRGDIHARALAEYAGVNLRTLSGYGSRFELVRSLETGEIDAACGWPLRDLQTRRARASSVAQPISRKREDPAHLCRGGFIRCQLSVLDAVAAGRHAAHLHPLLPAGGDLVADAFACDLSLELGKRQ